MISDELRQRLVAKAEQQTGDHLAAVEAVDEALKFLKSCAEHPAARLAPTPVADIGWHTFLLFTRDYAEFCQRVAGGFIHHEPLDGVATCEAHECRSVTADCDNGVSCANNCRGPASVGVGSQ